MKKDILTSIFIGALTFGALHVIKRLWRRYLRPIRKYTTIDLIGNTPLLYLKELSKLTKCEIYAKLEYLNPGGSLKDRLAKQIVLDGEAAGQLKKPGDRIYEGTSGSTGISLALLAAFRGYECVLYLPDDLSEEKYNSLELVGAKLNKVRPVSIIDSEHFCKLAEKAAKETNGFYANQFENLSNFKTHYNNTGPEIYKQTNGKVTTFVASAGTGGTIAGVSNYLKHKNPKVKVVLADPPGSSLMNKINFGVLYTHEEAEGHRVRHPFDTITEGIGLNRLTKNFEIAKIDQAFRVTDEESLAMGKFLIEKEGIFVGSSSALNAVACVKAARTFGEGQVIVTIFSDSGTRYMSKFYSKQWLIKYNAQLLESLKHHNADLSFVQ